MSPSRNGSCGGSSPARNARASAASPSPRRTSTDAVSSLTPSSAASRATSRGQQSVSVQEPVDIAVQRYERRRTAPAADQYSRAGSSTKKESTTSRSSTSTPPATYRRGWRVPRSWVIATRVQSTTRKPTAPAPATRTGASSAARASVSDDTAAETSTSPTHARADSVRARADIGVRLDIGPLPPPPAGQRGHGGAPAARPDHAGREDRRLARRDPH